MTVYHHHHHQLYELGLVTCSNSKIFLKLRIHSSNGSTTQIWPWPPPLRFLNHTELDTHTVGLLWTSDQPIAEASTYTGQHNI
jgi:hypothetical protein